MLHAPSFGFAGSNQLAGFLQLAVQEKSRQGLSKPRLCTHACHHFGKETWTLKDVPQATLDESRVQATEPHTNTRSVGNPEPQNETRSPTMLDPTARK